jgi:flagellar FliL protein
MSDVADLDLDDEPTGRGGLMKWLIIGLVALVVLGGAGGAAWYFLLGGSGGHREAEQPLPYFLDLKPFVVSMPSNTGTPQFVQVGVSLQLPRPAASEMITALLPQIQDAMRETFLAFKSDDLKNTEGVNKVRQSLVKHLNEVLASALGAERIAKLTAGSPSATLVQNVMFPTLVVE